MIVALGFNMVLANEVNPVNQLYRELSSRYKAGWTFHRFMLGLRKFFGSQDLDDRRSEFQQLYQSLKEASARLNDVNIAPVIEQLEVSQRTLDDLMWSLDEQDRKIAPSLVRLFFQRVTTQDERILIDLLRFYIEVQRGRTWEAERSDKVDYLLSRLGALIVDVEGGGDPERLKRVLVGISEYVGAAPVDPQKVANRMKLIQAVRNEIEQIETFEALTERDLVGHYRNVKHGLGALAFAKSILPMIVSTNLAVAARVNALTEKAQAKIFADYEKVSELEGRGLLATDLAESVSQLHAQVGTFRKQAQGGTLRLGAITEIQEAMQIIFGRIELDETADLDEELRRGESLSVHAILATEAERTTLGSGLEILVSSLRDTRRSGSQLTEVDPRLLDYRLAPREIEAFARLASGARCNVALEQFLLAASSLKCKIASLADELDGIGPEASQGGRAELLDDAAMALQLGDSYLRQFDHFLAMRLLDRETPGGGEVQVLKMRLTREFSGLWLKVHDSSRPRLT